MRAFIASVAAVLAVAPTVAATGKAVVKNKCDFPVYLWSVSNVDGDMHTLDANDGEYSETYRTNPNGGGISIKMATGKNYYTSSVAQFEYTLGNTLWYDLSDINGNPFMQYGYTLVPSDKNCRDVACAAGDATCKEVYLVPDDNHATADCSNEANTVLVLCSGQDSSDTVSGEAASVAAGAVGAAFTPIASIVNNVLGGNNNGNKNNNNNNKAAAVTPAPQAPAATPTVNVAAISQAPAAPAAAAAEDNDGAVVVTTFVTQYAQAEATPESQPQWAGHHLASEGWEFHPDSKVKRHHQHHPEHNHAAAEQ